MLQTTRERGTTPRASSTIARDAVKWRLWPALAATLATVTGFHLATLMRVPAPFVDEGWNASRAWALIHTGKAFGTLDAGVFDRYEGHWTYFPWLAAWIHSLFMRLFGPELFALRFASLVFGALLLAAVFVVARRLYSTRTGVLAAALLALSFNFLYSSHLGRHDIIVAALGFGALALYVTESREGGFPLKSVLVGLAVGLTPDIHLNGLIFGPAIAALYLLDHGRHVLRTGRFWGFVAGAAAGLAYFVAIHILPYPQTYAALGSLGNGSRVTPPLLAGDPAVWVASVRDTLFLLGLPLSLLVIVAFALLLLRSPSASDKTLLVFSGVLILTCIAVMRNKMGWYGIVVTPAAYLMAAAMLDRLWQEPWRGSLPAMLRTAFVTGLLVAAAAPALSAIREDSTPDYNLAIKRIRHAIPQGASVIGSQTYWFALPDTRYLSWDQLAYYPRYAPGSTLQDAFEELGADYFVMDGWLDLFVTDDPARLARSQSDTILSRKELQQFLGDHARLVDEFSTGAFGSVRIYKIDRTSSEK